MRSGSRWAFALATAYVFAALSADADPSPADKAMATQLFDDGEKLMAASNFAVACPKYSESNRLDPQLGTLLHAADCYEKAGKIASAWAGFKEAVEIAAKRNASGQKEPREQTARARATALEGKLSRLTITVQSPDPALEIQQDDRPVGRAVWGSGVPVDPGQHTVLARAPGRKVWNRSVDVPANGAKIEVVVPPLEPEGAPAPPVAPLPPVAPQPGPPAQTAPTAPLASTAAPAPAPMAPPGQPAETARVDTGSGSSTRTAGFVLVGAGVAGIGAGAVFGLMRNSKVDERDKICPTNHCTLNEGNQINDLTDQAKSAALMSNIAFGVGGAAAVVGVWLIVTGSSNEPVKSGAPLHLQPWAGAGSLGASMGGSW